MSEKEKEKSGNDWQHANVWGTITELCRENDELTGCGGPWINY